MPQPASHTHNPCAYDPFMQEVIDGDPYPIYARLRCESPRLYIEKYDTWFFSTFEDVWALSKGRELSVAHGITPSQLLLNSPANEFMVSQMDPPIHTHYRTLLNTIFKPAAAKTLEDTIRGRAKALLAGLVARSGGDVMKDFASPLAAEVGCILSGLPREDVPLQMQWNGHFFHRKPGHRGDTEVGGQAFSEIVEYVTARMHEVRRGRLAAGGTLGLLLEAQRTDPSVTDDHIVYMVFNMQIAAGDTVPKGMAATLHRLWESPDQLGALRSDPAQSLDAFLEGVRIDMPTQMQGRVAAAPVSLGARAGTEPITIQPGQRAMYMFASANRDEQEFEAPDSYRIGRGSKRTLDFGHGLHRCLGVHVAQVEGRIAIEEALSALPNYQIDLANSSHHKTEFLKGWSKLTMTL